MNQVITINTKTLREVLTRLDSLTREIKAIKARLFDEDPPYGSDAWWKKEIEEGLEEVREGKVRGPFKNANELIRALHQEVADKNTSHA